MRLQTITPVILVSNDCYWLPYTLESLRDRFAKFVIYDVGSKDGTLDIIDYFSETEKADFFIRKMPMCGPVIQGAFRNSMIAETQSEWYFMADGDEVLDEKSLDILCRDFYKTPANKIYGVIRRKEIAQNLSHCYDVHRTHHRVYHRTAIWKGTHPGEEAVIPQNKDTEHHFPNVLCYHFHNTLRSTLEGEVPKRMYRKQQKTYHPGELVPFNLLEELPILRKPINNFPVNPELEKLQHAINKM